jgi:hypothetical protein
MKLEGSILCLSPGRRSFAKVRQAGAHVVTAPWIQRSSGGAEIEFELVGEGDLAVAMMALAE